MMPALFQVPSLPSVALHKTVALRSFNLMVLSCPSAKNPKALLCGDQNGPRAPDVSGSRRPSEPSVFCMYKKLVSVSSTRVTTTCWPSGEIATARSREKLRDSGGRNVEEEVSPGSAVSVGKMIRATKM